MLDRDTITWVRREVRIARKTLIQKWSVEKVNAEKVGADVKAEFIGRAGMVTGKLDVLQQIEDFLGKVEIAIVDGEEEGHLYLK